MNQENDRDREMRSEYDIRGGVRGKYAERYKTSITTVTAHTFTSTLIASVTSSAELVGAMTRSVSYPPFQPSPRIQLGGHRVTADAG